MLFSHHAQNPTHQVHSCKENKLIYILKKKKYAGREIYLNLGLSPCFLRALRHESLLVFIELMVCTWRTLNRINPI